MSQVKNNDPFAALGRLASSAWNEAGRVVQEGGQRITEDIDSVGKAVQTGGFAAGAAQLVDVTSGGHLAANLVEVIVPGESLPPALKEGISLGVNMFGANLPAVAKDAFDLYNAMNAGSGGKAASGGSASAGQRMQTPEKPSTALERAKERKHEVQREHRREAIEEAKSRAKEAAREKAQNNRIDSLEKRVAYLEELNGVTSSGYSSGVDGSGVGDAGGVAGGGGIGGDNGLADDLFAGDFAGADVGKSRNDSRMRKFERDLEEANREIDRILNNPNLSFEDLIFLLMRAVIKQGEAETKLSLQQEKVGRDLDRATRDVGRDQITGLQAELTKKTEELAGAKKPEDQQRIQGQISTIRGQIDDKQARLNDQVNDRTESRSERFEELKESLQKLSEMQQALSNIMNTLHQTAMNAIGNIR